MIRPLLHARRIRRVRDDRTNGPLRRPSGLELFFDRGRTAHTRSVRRGELAQNRFHLEGFDNVVRFHVVEILERDTAFVALRDFARVVLEALQGRELAFPYRAPVADQARAGAADDLAVHDHASRDSRAGDVENLADFGAAERLLAVSRCEQPFHRLAHVVDRFVDDGVEANLDAFFLGEVRGLRFGTDVEADYDGFGSRRERHVGFGDRSGRAVNHLKLDLVGREPRERVGERFDRALHVALQDDFEFLDLAGGEPRAQIFERDAAGLGEFAFALLPTPILGDLAGLGFLGDGGEHGAGFRHGRKSEDFDRSGGAGLGEALAEMILHRADASVRSSTDERVALAERAFLDEHG